jgi:hypothetical protein
MSGSQTVAVPEHEILVERLESAAREIQKSTEEIAKLRRILRMTPLQSKEETIRDDQGLKP